MKIAVITSVRSFDGEAKLINQLFESGMEVLHLRKPGMEKENYLALLNQIEAVYHDRVALHSHHELAAEFGIKRLHYPAILRKNQALGVLRCEHPDKVLSTSIHHLEEIDFVREFDYTFLGPIFNSYSKPGYLGMGTANLQLPQKTGLQLFALGGVTVHNIASLKLLGFDGAGLLGWLWNDPTKVITNFNQIKCLIKENM